MTNRESVLIAHPKADCIRVERQYIVSAVFHNKDGTYGCWPIGCGETEELAWEHAARHRTVQGEPRISHASPSKEKS